MTWSVTPSADASTCSCVGDSIASDETFGNLVLLLEKLHALGVLFASLNEGIDAPTPTGRLQMHMLAALSEFERGRIQERVRVGLARARANGRRIGRPGHRVTPRDLERTARLSIRAAAKTLEVSPAVIHRLRSQIPADVRRQEEPETQGLSQATPTVHERSGL